MLDPGLLQLFVYLAEERHVGHAADRAGLAQSTASTQLMRLEDTIGAPLFTRRKRAPIRLTDVGELFLIEARAALDRLGRAETIGRAAARGEAGHIALGYIFSAATNGVLPRLLTHARRTFPMVEMVPRLAETPEQIRAISERRLDIALVRPRPAYPAGVLATIVHEEPLRLFLGQDHPLAGLATIPADALESQTVLLPQFNERVGLREHVERLAAAAGTGMPDTVHTGDFITAASMAAAGYGIVLAPASLARLGMASLVMRTIEGFADHIRIALLRHEDCAPTTRRLADLGLADLATSDAFGTEAGAAADVGRTISDADTKKAH